MSFPRQLLNRDEEIVLDVHPHWLFFAEPALTVLGLIIVLIIAAATVGSPLTVIVLILIAIALIWTLWRFLTWRFTHFVVTNDRLIYRSGIFAKRGIQIPLERVNNVNFKQGILERIVGAGDLLVESAGEDGQQHFTDVRHPDQIQNIIHDQMNENERRSYPAMPAPGGNDPATQLEKLEGMLERGTLTREEFEAEKHRLLGQGGFPPPGAPPPPPPGATR
jgi:membrane protein YdbS with pleckstrin-like domain